MDFMLWADYWLTDQPELRRTTQPWTINHGWSVVQPRILHFTQHCLYKPIKVNQVMSFHYWPRVFGLVRFGFGSFWAGKGLRSCWRLCRGLKCFSHLSIKSLAPKLTWRMNTLGLLTASSHCGDYSRISQTSICKALGIDSPSHRLKWINVVIKLGHFVWNISKQILWL